MATSGCKFNYHAVVIWGDKLLEYIKGSISIAPTCCGGSLGSTGGAGRATVTSEVCFHKRPPLRMPLIGDPPGGMFALSVESMLSSFISTSQRLSAWGVHLERDNFCLSGESEKRYCIVKSAGTLFIFNGSYLHREEVLLGLFAGFDQFSQFLGQIVVLPQNIHLQKISKVK